MTKINVTIRVTDQELEALNKAVKERKFDSIDALLRDAMFAEVESAVEEHMQREEEV